MSSTQQPTMAGPKTFKDMPNEVKTRIYSFVLPQDQTFRLDVYGGRQKFFVNGKAHARKAEDEIALMGHHRNKMHRGMKWDGVAKKWIEVDNNGLALLYTNKEIYNLAAPLLYSKNRFEFKTTDALSRFLKQISPNMHQHVHTISISTYGWSTKNGRQVARDAMMTLASAKSLRTLEVSRFEFCEFHFHGSRFWSQYTATNNLNLFKEAKLDNMETLIDLIKPLIIELGKAYKVQNLKLDPFKVVKVVNMPFLPARMTPSFSTTIDPNDKNTIVPKGMGTIEERMAGFWYYYWGLSGAPPPPVGQMPPVGHPIQFPFPYARIRCIKRLGDNGCGQVNEMMSALFEQKLAQELQKHQKKEGEAEAGDKEGAISANEIQKDQNMEAEAGDEEGVVFDNEMQHDQNVETEAGDEEGATASE